MIGRVLSFGRRILYLGITVVGFWIALGGYPPSAGGIPVQLAVGMVFGLIGLAGVIFPEKIRSGSGSGPD
jgi:hypothetical protein